jgi:hypothetical protein
VLILKGVISRFVPDGRGSGSRLAAEPEDITLLSFAIRTNWIKTGTKWIEFALKRQSERCGREAIS